MTAIAPVLTRVESCFSDLFPITTQSEHLPQHSRYGSRETSMPSFSLCLTLVAVLSIYVTHIRTCVRLCDRIDLIPGHIATDLEVEKCKKIQAELRTEWEQPTILISEGKPVVAGFVKRCRLPSSILKSINQSSLARFTDLSPSNISNVINDLLMSKNASPEEAPAIYQWVNRSVWCVRMCTLLYRMRVCRVFECTFVRTYRHICMII